MNSKLYKKVHQQATAMLKACEENNETAFQELYEELRALCYEHEDEEHKNHPVQWETLADFTEEVEQALAYYNKALKYGLAIDAYDYIASTCYAMAILLKDAGKTDIALQHANQAAEYSNKIEDSELQREISQLVKRLSH